MSDPGTDLLDMDEVLVSPSAALRIPGHRALRHLMMPFFEQDSHLLIACADPQDESSLLAIERLARSPVRPIPAEAESLRRAIHATYGAGVRPAASGPTSSTPGDEHIHRVDDILNAASIRDASDIHIDPGPKSIDVRFRVHGQLEAHSQLSPAAYAGLVGRIKVLAKMDIAEKRLPQDGQITHTSELTGRNFVLRAATIPTPHGEKLTLRLLGNRNTPQTLDALGMTADGLENLTQAISQPNGLVLLTGPTGSGKSSTLYAALRHLSQTGTRNIITIEEPIESPLAGVTQVEADPERLTFATALRSILRHDPDIILVGEIRDRETADIALRAAITGHIVLSTLHTRSAAAAVTRLLDLGIERYLLAATLRLVIAQRLVRQLCRHCRRPRPLTDTEARLLRQPTLAGKTTVYEPGGCIRCNLKGYVSRRALFEHLPVDSGLRATIGAGADEAKILTIMHQAHHRDLLADGLRQAIEGLTTIQEVLRIVGS
jgi:type IV pilus assembly protein PilB